jgi:NAD-dependent deacetylase
MSDFPPTVLEGICFAADIIRESSRGIALTGAGISTPSGIPDFRSPNSGLWSRFDPFEVASLTAFRYHPEKFYNWIRPLATNVLRALPNPAHHALTSLEKASHLLTIITQNIDGLQQRSGARNVLEVHGSMETLTCVGCYQHYQSADFIEPFLTFGEIPSCPNCGNILKPDLVLFGEQMPAWTWNKAQEACRKCEVMIVAGSSLEVMPVASLPLQVLEKGAHLIVINQSPTYLDLRADVVIHADVAEILPRIAKEVIGE